MSPGPPRQVSWAFGSGRRDALELRVREVCQTSSGGDHVTIYEADIEIVPGDVQVEVAGIDPPDADPDAVASAREAIQAGAAQVLRPRGLGAIIRLRRVVVHPVDFKPRRFERHTAEAVQRLFGEIAEARTAADQGRPFGFSGFEGAGGGPGG